MQSVLEQLLARRAQIIVMCNNGDNVIKELCNHKGCQTIEVRLLTLQRGQCFSLIVQWISNVINTIFVFKIADISLLLQRQF